MSCSGDEADGGYPGAPPLCEEEVAGGGGDMKPKLLLLGMRRSGKSSIQNVVFHKMSPNETLFLESTNKIAKDEITNTSCVHFTTLDFPGQIDFFDEEFNTDGIFGGVGALVYVIDSQDDYTDALVRLSDTVLRVFTINPLLKFEVFVHKADGLADDTKNETRRDIENRATEDLHHAANAMGIDIASFSCNFHLTSIYDHSIFEAMSKVVQKLIPELPTLENLLTSFNTLSGIDKSFLFDVSAKIYIATDYAPVDMQSYELCCDMIDVVLDISSIYGMDEEPADAMCFDASTYSCIRLDNDTVVLMWHVSRYLALLAIVSGDKYTRPGIIEYNYNRLKKGLLEIFQVRERFSRSADQTSVSCSAGLSVENKLLSGSLLPSSSLLDTARTEGHATARNDAVMQSDSKKEISKSKVDYEANALGGATCLQNEASTQRALESSADGCDETSGTESSTAPSPHTSRGRTSDVAATTSSQARRRASGADQRGAGPAEGGVAVLPRGKVLVSGGGAQTTYDTSAGVVGNTYVMTSEDGMVLV